MQLQLDNRPYVPVTINGTGPWWFLLDTGSLAIQIERALLGDMGLQEIEPGVARVESLGIDRVERQDLSVAANELSSVSDVCGRRVPGMIGTWLLASTRLTLDYPRSVGACVEAPEAEPLAPEAHVPLAVANHYALVPVHVNGEGPFDFLLDTGSSASIVSTELADELGLNIGEAGWSRGAADARKHWRTCVDRLAVGKVVREQHEVIAMNCQHVCEYTGRRVRGYIGHHFLANFCLTLAMSDGCVVFS